MSSPSSPSSPASAPSTSPDTHWQRMGNYLSPRSANDNSNIASQPTENSALIERNAEMNMGFHLPALCLLTILGVTGIAVAKIDPGRVTEITGYSIAGFSVVSSVAICCYEKCLRNANRETHLV